MDARNATASATTRPLEQLELFPPEETYTRAVGQWWKKEPWNTYLIEFGPEVTGIPRVMSIEAYGKTFTYNLVHVKECI